MTVDALVADLFRRSSGELTAALVRVLGPEHLELAEEVVQDALVRALEVWSYQGVPDNPRGWLYRVARNRALDLLRRHAAGARKLSELVVEQFDTDPARVRGDDELAMVFMCCHPALSRESQVALTLKVVGGFNVKEIAAAFLADPTAMAQRLVRAKQVLQEQDARFEPPTVEDQQNRLDTVLAVIYLLFTEGHNSHVGDVVVRGELCAEAIRLADLLLSNPATTTPAVHALQALMLLHASRLAARSAEELVLLHQQDRTTWDRTLIVRGLHHLEQASAGDRITAYHVQAAIAAAHATAPSAEETDWSYILDLYDQLLLLTPTPVVQLHRAVALSRVAGPHAAINELEELAGDPALRRYYLYPAVLGALWSEAGDAEEAITYFERALQLPCNEVERRLLESRLASARNACQRTAEQWAFKSD